MNGRDSLFAPEPRVKAVLLAIEGTAWLVEYLPEIRSYYFDSPKSLQELQDAVDDPQPGYQIHHIVESQYNSTNPDSNSRRFGVRLESSEKSSAHPEMEPSLAASRPEIASAGSRGMNDML